MRYCIALLIAVVSFQLVARDDTRLDEGWKFAKGEAIKDGQSVVDETNWLAITIPHCWGWEEAQAGEKNYYRGPAWYQRELDATVQPGRRYFLKFEAASSVAAVYLNGKLIGEHRGAFGAFCFEITPYLAGGAGTNLLAVRVDNSAQPDVAPLAGDFAFYGGLYRPVHLVETDEHCFTPTDHGAPGVTWLQSRVTKEEAVLDVTAEITTGSKPPKNLTVVASLFDTDGKCVATTSESVLTRTNLAEMPCWLHLTVPKPHLWNGRIDPYLYKAVVELHSTNQLWDTVEQQVGLRSYRVDPTNGFFLNDKPYALHGVDKHQERWNKGWAVSEADLDEDISLIKEIGATCIRCAHYQHCDYFYSLCDRAGILVWAELPQVDEINASSQFAATSRNQLLDLIRQNVNHPSIFVWSLSNEIRANKADPHRELMDLNNVAHSEDPTRLTIMAVNGDAEKLPQMAKIPDLLGWNLYPGWYGKSNELAGFGSRLDSHRYSSRYGGYCISEYGAGANFLQHEENPTQVVTTNQWHPEEWQCYVHERDWAVLKSKPFVWATFAWVMFDFTSPVRHEGGVIFRNDKGLVTADRAVKKDVFYFYKANWSAEPTLYLTERRFTERTNAVTGVKVYSNAKSVELFVNDVSQGRNSHPTNAVFVWNNVTLHSGDNQIEARANHDGQNLEDHCVWKLAGP
ncbi:MAG TPA: glycoside hydrolase family 2 TIM barrel-domain containing protein [Desulfuromonadaceae bacterium]|nr:glycoside hydrolase family 2 TIM barrel-domain containing protein [Desulfuromonadaceae bacterium]